MGLLAAAPAAASGIEPVVLEPVAVGDWTKAAATPPVKSTPVAWKNETVQPS